jgi:hypothetical protein
MTFFYEDPIKTHQDHVLLALNLPENYRYCQIATSSLFPDQIIDLLKTVDQNVNGIILDNSDIWRYSDNELLQNWIANDHRDYFIITLGYQNKKIIPRMYELSLPYVYYIRQKLPIDIKPKNLHIGFGCLNFKITLPRLMLGCALYNNKLLDKVIFTQNNKEFVLHGFEQVLSEQLPNVQEYMKLLPIGVIPDDQIDAVAHTSDLHNVSKLCYCNIVTETETEFFGHQQTVPTPVVTEKSFRPFHTCQIPVFLASQGHLAYLKNLGFEVMEDLLPVGYDDMNTFEKVDSIVELVNKGKEYIENFYFSHLKELRHNYELISSDKIEKVMIQQIRNVL